jgi:peptidoglycan/LPS O-acetylase OafA/YrhL
MKLLGVEASRGFAAMLVVMFHASEMLVGPKYFGAMPFAGVFRFGHAGVDFFFVLSGFIIYFVHAGDIGHPERLGAYAWKRFVRIYPVYWAVLVVMGGLLAYSPTTARSEQHIGNILTTVFLVPSMIGPFLDVAWSLKHEILFYLLFGALFLNRRAGQALLGAWGLLVAWNVVVTWVTGRSFFGGIGATIIFPVFNIEFFFGIAVAHTIRTRRFWYPFALIIVGLLLFVGTGLAESWGPLPPNNWPPQHLAYAAGAALTLYGLAAAETAGRLKVPAALVIIGSSSYSIYLTHTIAMLVLQQVVLLLPPRLRLTGEVWFLIFVVASTLGGVVFCRLVEQPLLRRFRPRRLLAAAS